ncbi:hypothetical protein LWI29_000938 [Acer saccharum]|uniref:Allene oxide synthase n=1 Tax=Acer saccharum TaxID=4024 RepID=A0AA39RWT5_ACESA|nr:hypothetical protein LWI29_000938 [Acer saccharum]
MVKAMVAAEKKHAEVHAKSFVPDASRPDGPEMDGSNVVINLGSQNSINDEMALTDEWCKTSSSTAELPNTTPLSSKPTCLLAPFMASNPRVIAVLDAVSFPVLFDTSKVEKRNVLDGTFFPSVKFTGGHRVCAYLDPSEPNHTAIKSYFLSVLAKNMTTSVAQVCKFSRRFVLHTFPLPSFLVKSDYNKLYEAFYTFSGSVLDEAERFGINREEACHNLVFLAGFNAYGGSKTLFPALIKWVGLAGEELHRQLAEEIRTVVKAEGGVTLSALDQMVLTKSVVYEALRIEPPVPFQYGKAKVDMVVQSHDAAFEIKKGDMIFGYQPFATKDPRVFDNPEEFVGQRFVGDQGKKLLKYVYWSNGRETDDPTAENKQCPGKNLVVLLSRVMLVEFFLRYDTFTVEAGKLPLGSSVTFKSLTKATST